MNQLNLSHILSDKHKILLVAPQKWSGDDICALLSLQSILKDMGKDVTAIGPNTKPHKYEYLRTNIIQQELPEQGHFVLSLDTTEHKIQDIKYRKGEKSIDILIVPEDGVFTAQDMTLSKGLVDLDLIITVGANALEDLGNVYQKNASLFMKSPILNLSASADNEHFGRLHGIDPNASSVCEILTNLCEGRPELETHITADIATLLLTGIISSTESFLEPNTPQQSFYTASKLFSKGAKHSEIIDHLFKMKNLSTLKAWGEILENLELDIHHKIGWSHISESDFFSIKASPEEVEDLNDELLRHLKDAELSVLFLEKKKSVTIQVRSNIPQINMNDLNTFLGGTGEKTTHGLNFDIEKKRIIEIEYEFLMVLLKYQKKRLNIDENVPLERLCITQEVQDSPHKKTPTQKPYDGPAKAPEFIPFILDEKHPTKNSSPVKKEEPQKNIKEAPSKESTKEGPKLPSWLKK